MDRLQAVVAVLHACLWGWPVLGLLLFTGVFLTFRLHFLQFRAWRQWISAACRGLFGRGEGGARSRFRALSTALAGSLGTGNIVGVAAAIAAGGPGAVFWMWVSALFGMATLFTETALGVRYRCKQGGAWRAGAMYYLEHGLSCRPLAAVFAVGCVLAALGMGNLVQARSLSSALHGAFGIPEAVCGAAAALLLFAVLRGGAARVGRVTSVLVPALSGGYFLACAVVLACHAEAVLPAFASIFRGAFGFRAAAGGFSGAALAAAVKTGLSRGIFSNEAGLGSSSLAHANASGGAQELGFQGMFQVFLDTIVLCTLTALVLLCSGAPPGDGGAQWGAAAFGTVFGPAGEGFLAWALALFAFATMLGWCYYGECGARYLGGGRKVRLFRAAFVLAAFAGAQMDLQLAWDLSDLCNGLMAIPNAAALLLLAPGGKRRGRPPSRPAARRKKNGPAA